MAPQTIPGRFARLEVSTDGDVFYNFAGIVDVAMSISVSELETTTHDSNGGRTFIPGLIDYSMTSTNRWQDGDPGQDIVLENVDTKRLVHFRYTLQTAAGRKQWEGLCFLRTGTLAGPLKESATFAVTLRCSGVRMVRQAAPVGPVAEPALPPLAPLPDALVLLYTMEAASISGATVTDYSGTARNGTLVNTPAQVAGPTGGALSFVAADLEYVSLSRIWSTSQQQRPYSIVAHVKPVAGQAMTVFFDGAYTGGAYGFIGLWLHIDAAGGVDAKFTLADGPFGGPGLGFSVNTGPNPTMMDGQFHDIVVTVDRRGSQVELRTVNIYFDGALIYSGLIGDGAWQSTAGAINTLAFIGRFNYGAGTDEYATGTVGELAFFAKDTTTIALLTQADVDVIHELRLRNVTIREHMGIAP